jgi:long-chain fatty acid transport protein
MNATSIFSTTLRIMVILFTIILFNSTTYGTNGYFSHGYGTQHKGLAGASTALPLNTMIAASNPAGMIFLGQRYDVSLGIFNPNREYTISGNPSGIGFGLAPGTIESDSKYFLIPALGANWMINEENSFGLSLFGNGGMNTDYDTKTFDSPFTTVSKPTGVDLSQLFLSATYARKLTEKHALGISAILAYQRFRAEGLQAFAGLSIDGTKISNNDYSNSTGYGAKIGYLGEIISGLHLGASYQTKVMMSEFDEYAGLFAEQGDFDIPSSWSAGLALQASSDVTIVADIQQILYSGIKSINNPLDPTSLNPQANPAGFRPLGSDNAAGFGWEDMTIYKFGLQWEGMPGWTFRAGYSFGEQPIPDNELLFNILAPGVIEQHLTFGFSKKLDEQELSFALMHGFTNSITGPNTLEIPDAQTIELKMSQWEFELGFSL